MPLRCSFCPEVRIAYKTNIKGLTFSPEGAIDTHAHTHINAKLPILACGRVPPRHKTYPK